MVLVIKDSIRVSHEIREIGSHCLRNVRVSVKEREQSGCLSTVHIFIAYFMITAEPMMSNYCVYGSILNYLPLNIVEIRPFPLIIRGITTWDLRIRYIWWFQLIDTFAQRLGYVITMLIAWGAKLVGNTKVLANVSGRNRCGKGL